MKTWFYCLLLVAICAGGVARAGSSDLSFLKPGSWYEVSLPNNTQLTAGRPAYDGNATTSTNLKIIQSTGSHWYLVEYDSVVIPTDASGRSNFAGSVTIKRSRLWLNFDQVMTVSAASEPDYKTLYQDYKGGVKVAVAKE